MKRIAIQLRKDQYDQLKELSCPGTSIASMVRQAVDNYLSASVAEKPQRLP